MSEPRARVSAATVRRALGGALETLSTGRDPAYLTLGAAIRAAVLDGRIALRTRLPSERELAGEIEVSRTTVAAAYHRLREQGYLTSKRGSGSVTTLPATQATTGAGRSTVWMAGTESEDELINLSVANLPAPAEALDRALQAAVGEIGRYTGDHGYYPLGLSCLRQAVADRYTEQGLPTTADEILITNGAQHALTLALREFTTAGDRVLVECPTYPNALDAVRAARCRPAPVGLGAEGWDGDLIAATLRQAAPRLGYVIPDFQNPTGLLMPAEDRERLVRDATASGTALLVDETFRDLAFDGLVPPSVARWDDRGLVLLMGSLNKAFWGGLRIGWIRTTPRMVLQLGNARACGDMGGPVIDQLVATHVVRHEAGAIAERRERLAAGCEAAMASLAEHAPTWTANRVAGGVSLWVGLPAPIATDLAHVAAAAGVRVTPGPRFGPDGTMDRFFRLPFTIPAHELDTAVRRLAMAAEQVRPGSHADQSTWVA